MASRQDQIQSYQFVVQRVVSAFVAGEPDVNPSPLRRLAGAGFASLMVAVLLAAAMGVFGLIVKGGNKTWRDGRSVIIEAETGATYIYSQGTLYPMANLSSALLWLGAPADRVRVSRKSLDGVPRGPMLGILGAPDALPSKDRVLAPPWTVCSRRAQTPSGNESATTILTLGEAAEGGEELGERGVLVQETRTRRLYLVWHGYRFRLPDPEGRTETTAKIVLSALGLPDRAQVLAGGAWVNALPAGARIGTVDVPNRGAPSSAVAGAIVGQLFVKEALNGTRQYFVAYENALAELTEMQASVLRSDPATEAAYPDGRVALRVLSEAEAAVAPRQQAATGAGVAPPAQTPELVSLGTGGVLCADYVDDRNPPTIRVNSSFPEQTGAATAQTDSGVTLADSVVIRPGWGALVEATTSPEATVGALFVVTDSGVRHAVPSREILAVLGLADVTPVRLPARLVGRLPEGPSLDPEHARHPVDLD